MLMVIITWIYAGITIFIMGFGISMLCSKLLGYRIKSLDGILMAGLVAATVYAQFFSLFYRVSLLANVILVIACILIAIFWRGDIRSYIHSWYKVRGRGEKVAVLLLLLLWSFFTSRGYIHYDSDLYHAQSIRWIEEYAVVPGLGNLHERFAYNSSMFALSALYSLKFLLGDSMHTMNGFLAFILSLATLDIYKSRKERRFELSDYAKAAAIYYLTLITDEVVSPASDYAIMCVVFYLVIKWLDCLKQDHREKEKDKGVKVVPYTLLCILGVYALTLKLTAGLILILLIKPAYILLKNKDWKKIGICLVSGFVVAMPWFIRTIVISGWLLYPFPALDLFPVDWKMDAELVAIDAAQISAWGKALYNIGVLHTPASQWIPNWFRTTLSGTEKILIFGALACTICNAVGCLWMLLKKQWKYLDMSLVLFTVTASYVFWQFSAPLIRYGYAYVLLVDFLTVSWLAFMVKKEKWIYYIILLYGIYKVFALCGEIGKTITFKEYYLCQQDYGIYEMIPYELEGITFYRPESGDLQGYDYFPAAPLEADIEFRGEGLQEGFRRK